MINNFLCSECGHSVVCEKLKPLMKFHDSAKKDLMITITMNDCVDFAPEDEKAEDEEDEI